MTSKRTSSDEEFPIRGTHQVALCLEAEFDELKCEILRKIDKEMTDSKNSREYLAQKYDELCKKIQSLGGLDSTMSGFRCDVRAVEKQVVDLAARVDDIEKTVIRKECPSLSSSAFNITK